MEESAFCVAASALTATSDDGEEEEHAHTASNTADCTESWKMEMSRNALDQGSATTRSSREIESNSPDRLKPKEIS
jgi:hypothetical protein